MIHDTRSKAIILAYLAVVVSVLIVAGFGVILGNPPENIARWCGVFALFFGACMVGLIIWGLLADPEQGDKK